MTFFYNLNKTLNAIREKPETTHGQLNERDMGKHNNKTTGFKALADKAAKEYGSKTAGERVAGAQFQKMKKAGQLEEEGMSRAAKGYEKYGKEGMEALAKAGREGKDLDKVRDKYNKYDESIDEGFVDAVKSGARAALGAIGNTIGHGSDEDMIRDLQKKAGLPVTGKVPPQQGQQAQGQLPAPGQQPMAEEGGIPMTPKQKSFAAIAPPKDKITFADKIAGAKKEVDEMLGDVAAEAMKSALGRGKKVVADEGEDNSPFTAHKRPRVEVPKVGTVTRGSKHDVEEIPGGRRVTRRVDPSGISVGADDDKSADGEKRGRGRPKGPAKAPERVTGGATKHKGGRKTNEGEVSTGNLQQMWKLVTGLKTFVQDPDGQALLKELTGMVKHYVNQGGEQALDEKAVSKKQQKFMGMVHAAQKGEKPASKEVAKTAKSMGKKDAEDFAATKHKGLPEKKKSDSKKEKTDETTTAGSIAPAAGAPKAKSNSVVGKGIYDSLNRKLEGMIAESMNVSVNMNKGEDGQARKSITVSAEGEAAEQLAQLLNLAGMAAKGDDHGGCGCETSPCSCEQMVDENAPDWPTNTEIGGEDDPHLRMYAGGLNGPKSTGQTTGAPFNRQNSRQGTMAEGTDLGMKLYAELKGFKAK